MGERVQDQRARHRHRHRPARPGAAGAAVRADREPALQDPAGHGPRPGAHQVADRDARRHAGDREPARRRHHGQLPAAGAPERPCPGRPQLRGRLNDATVSGWSLTLPRLAACRRHRRPGLRAAGRRSDRPRAPQPGCGPPGRSAAPAPEPI